MPCENYKNALIEAAASGAEPQTELRSHLATCATCRTVFAEEQALFASIDAGLHVTANAEVPVSLVPRVRARLDEEYAPRRSWATKWLVLASAAAIFVSFFAARAPLHTNVAPDPVDTAGIRSAPTQLSPSPRNQFHVVAPPVEKNPDSQHQLAIAKNPPKHETLAGGETMPEVLVPRDQEILLAAYAKQWSLHKRAPLLAKNDDTTILEPLQVAPIQIAELDVKLLAEEKSQ